MPYSHIRNYPILRPPRQLRWYHLIEPVCGMLVMVMFFFYCYYVRDRRYTPESYPSMFNMGSLFEMAMSDINRTLSLMDQNGMDGPTRISYVSSILVGIGKYTVAIPLAFYGEMAEAIICPTCTINRLENLTLVAGEFVEWAILAVYNLIIQLLENVFPA